MASEVRVVVYYDFASSICYVGHRVMQRMEPVLDRLDVALEWRPIDLTLLTGWRRGAPIQGPGRENAHRVAADLGVEIRMPTRWLDSRRACDIALQLIGQTSEPAWRERVFSAIHEEGRSLAEPDALVPLARDIGLDLDSLSSDPEFEALAQETARARELMVSGVPTFMLGEFPVGGIQQDQTMESLLGRWAAKVRGDATD